jgi:starch-binding outer membrane protein, SusD/RagB family
MKMKIYKYIFGLMLMAALFTACNKDFLQRVPQTQITANAFFNTPQDLQTYSNGFYSQLPVSYDDLNSDNISSFSGGGYVDNLVRGSINPSNVGGWDDWGNLRSINFMLDNAGKAQGDTASIKHYIGIAHFFRALFYINKVKDYSDVPWYSHAQPAGDSSLYKPADPRSMVTDSILADLQYAVDHIKPAMGDGTRVNEWSALQLMARFCLYEGTYRKYHAEINLSNDYERFLQKAVWAAQQIMQSGNFSITGSGAAGYRALFTSASLSGNKEIIQWANYNQALGVGNNTHTVLGWEWSLSRSLEQSYLMTDGTTFTSHSGYDTLPYTIVFANRDPRMAETIVYPGYAPNNDGKPYVPKPNLGGYDQLKFYPRDPAQRQGWVQDYTALPIYRYAETLLIYAEAKAELGTITQADVDATINLLRDRVQMPHLNIATANANIDARLASYYPNVSGPDAGIILEIRRERRVELACEGFRHDDLMRWYAGKRFQDAQEGMYVPKLGGLDMTGDGVPDIAILASPNDESPIANLPPDVKNNLSKFYLKDASGVNNNFYLTNGMSGFIAFTVNRDQPRVFIEPKYYYMPIPLTQLVLNTNLKQPYGW